MKKLMKLLVANRVRPYYIYQCDLSQGIEHFRTRFRRAWKSSNTYAPYDGVRGATFALTGWAGRKGAGHAQLCGVAGTRQVGVPEL
jgi:hypothetical protein